MEDGENDQNPGVSNTVQKPSPTEASSRGNWPLWISVIQTLVMALTFAGAVFIGFKQVEIGLQQTRIGIQQAEINQRLYDLNFTPSVEVTFDLGDERLNVYNRGRENIWLCGTRAFGRPRQIDHATKYLITPSGYYYMPAGEMVRRGRQLFESEESRTFADESDFLISTDPPGTRSRRVPAELFIEGADGQRYVVNIEFRFVLDQHDRLRVHTQTQSFIRTNWADTYPAR